MPIIVRMKNQNLAQTQENITKLKYDHRAFINELELNVPLNNQEDVEEVAKLTQGYLGYPDVSIATIHSEAHRMGNRDIEGYSKKGGVICPCCSFVVQDQELPLCVSIDLIANMGTSTFLFIKTFKHLGIVTLIISLLYSVYALVTNIIASNQTGAQLLTNVDYLALSLGSKQSNPTPQNQTFYLIQCWIGVGLVSVFLVAFIVISYFDLVDAVEYDRDTQSASDYSVVMKGVPTNYSKESMQKELDKYFEENKESYHLLHPFQIVKYNVGKPFTLNESDLKDEEYLQVEDKIKQNKKRLVQLIEERKQSMKFLTIKDERNRIYKQYEQLIQKKIKKISQAIETVKGQLKNEDADNAVVFVTLKTNLARMALCSMNRNDTYAKLKYLVSCCRRGSQFSILDGEKTIPIEIQRAPQPQDIIWNNIGASDFDLRCRKLRTYFVTVLLLGVSFVLVYALSLAQQSAGDNRFISILISIVIAIINALLNIIIYKLTWYEKDYTTSQRQASLAIKSVLAQAINNIVIPLVVARFIKKNIYSTSGLVDTIFFLGITNSFMPTILKIVDLSYIVNKIRACYKRRPNSRLTQNQIQFNESQTLLEFEVGSEYIYIVNLFLFVCFYVSLQPIISFFAAFGYLTLYWAQKYSLFNRCRRPVPGTDNVHIAMRQLILLGPLLYSLGSLTWSNFFAQGTPATSIVPNLIALGTFSTISGIALIIIILPSSLMLQSFLDQYNKQVTTYEENRFFFSSEYDRLNPDTQQGAIKEYSVYRAQKAKEFDGLDEEKQMQILSRLQKNVTKGQQSGQPRGQNFQISNQLAGTMSGLFGLPLGGSAQGVPPSQHALYSTTKPAPHLQQTNVPLFSTMFAPQLNPVQQPIGMSQQMFGLAQSQFGYPAQPQFGLPQPTYNLLNTFGGMPMQPAPMNYGQTNFYNGIGMYRPY